jgi:hypothetical protein
VGGGCGGDDGTFDCGPDTGTCATRSLDRHASSAYHASICCAAWIGNEGGMAPEHTVSYHDASVEFPTPDGSPVCTFAKWVNPIMN